MKTFFKLFLLIIFIFIIVSKATLNYQENNKPIYTVNYDSNYPIELYDLLVPINTEEIDLSNTKIDDTIIEKLSKFKNIKKINLKGQSLSSKLQHDLITAYPDVNFEWSITILDKSVDSNIETLNLSKCKINDLSSFKSSLSMLKNLKYLDMSDCNLSNEELAKLREEFPNTKIVWKIYLGKWSLKTDAVAFSVLVAHFDYVRMKSKDIEVLKYCTDLQALDLGHQSITDISVIGDYLPNLRLLILADNKIKDITPLSKLKHLHYLELFMNNIKDITPLVSCKELVDLNLAHIPALHDFSPLLKNDFPLLERLCMQNSGGTAKYYSSIKAKYPKVTIVHKGYGSTHSGWRTHPRYFAMIDMFYKRNYISELFTKYDNLVENN